MDKQKLKAFLISKETATINDFENSLDAFINESHIDYNDIRDEDDYSHHYQSSNDSNAAHRHLHQHVRHLAVLQQLDFAGSKKVEPGAVIQVNDRYMVVAVAESAFEFDGKKFISISPDSPVYQCMKDKKKGDSCHFNNHDFIIQEIY